MTVKVAVVGACGRMGSLLVELASEREDVELVGAVDRNRVGEKIKGVDISISSPENAEDVFENVDVVVEFTSPEGTKRFVEAAVSTQTPYVTGTTGLSNEVEDRVKRASEEIPVVRSSNFATGVNVFWRLVEQGAELLPDYDFEVTETHHRHKRDAPSGTAKTTVERIEKVIGERKHVHGREGEAPREDEIGIHARRAGEIVGEHEVLISGQGESVIITHRTGDRSTFAAGALDAAVFVTDKGPGLYGMEDVLGL